MPKMFNIEAYLNSLSENIEEIDVSKKKLTYLPDLSKFKKLKTLCCVDNQLVTLPLLPNSLEILCCNDNKLVSLPPLPNSLKLLYCNNNQLTSLPPLPNSLEILFCKNNPTDEFIHPYNLDVLKKETITLGKFRDLYYCIKYKNKFRKWLWKSREKKVKEEYHPDRLREMLEGKDINDIDF